MKDYLSLVSALCYVLSVTGTTLELAKMPVLMPKKNSTMNENIAFTLINDLTTFVKNQTEFYIETSEETIYSNDTTSTPDLDPQNLLDFFLMDHKSWLHWRTIHLGKHSNLTLSEFLRAALYIDRRRSRYCINVNNQCHFHFDYKNASNLWYERRKTFFALTSTFFSLTFVLGLTGNVMAIITLLRFVKSRSTTSAFILSLACADILIILFCVPFKALESFRYYWTSGAVACKVIALIQHISFISSILNMTVMSIERYFAICHAIKNQFVPTIQRTRRVILTVWFCALILATPCLFLWNYEYVGYSIIAKQDVYRCVPKFTSPKMQGFFIYQLIVLYLVPLFTMLYCYSHVIIALYRSNQNNAVIDEQFNVNQQSKEKSKEERKGRKKVIKMLLLLLTLFTFCWGPVIILSLIESFWFSGSRYPSYKVFMARQALFCLAYFNSCLNPLVYCFVSRQFRDGFCRIMKCSKETPKIPASDVAHISSPEIDGIISLQRATSSDSLNSDISPVVNKVAPEPVINVTNIETKFE